MAIMSWTEDYGSGTFLNYDMSWLQRDEYYLNIINNSTHRTLYFYSKYEECYKCLFKQTKSISSNITILESSEHRKIFRIITDDSAATLVPENFEYFCEIDEPFGEFGVYSVVVDDTKCSTETLKQPVNIYIPMFTVFLIYLALFSLIYLGGYAWRKIRRKLKTKTVDEAPPKKERVKSLDCFRGISIILMIFVNYGCGGYEILDHAVWNGLHVADVIFPWFLWIMGVCIPISLSSAFKRGTSKTSALLNVLRRSCILFLIGLFLGAAPYLDKFRALGVLQRFGICYFVVATICVLLNRSPDSNKCTGKYKALFLDILRLEFEWILVIAILVCHSYITFVVADPDCPRGYLGPGGYHNNGDFFNCTGGAAGYIDKLILGDHIYKYPTILKIYNSLSFDPEGILGSLTSIVQVFLGVQAGTTMLTYKRHAHRLYRWLAWALFTGVLGGGLCGFSKEEGLIPLNKNLWSISFVLVTSSLAFILLCVSYYIIDMKKWWTGKPFLFAGMNSTIMYIGHNMTYSNFLIHWYIDEASANKTHFMSLLDDVWATGIWVFVAYYLYKIKFFFSI